MIRLTQTVQKGGCAAKVAATELRKILSLVQFPPRDPSIRVDGSSFDDAAIQILTPDLALVHTMDFFTPILDTPSLFGRVAAANALSDVYAMGGTPKTAMAILAFPTSEFSHELVAAVLQGASDLLREAGVSLVGGHSIDDETLKFGLAVTGFVHPERVWSNAGAKPGDHLILTKPLGTGTLTAALKRSEVTESEIADAIESMGALNSVPQLLDESLAEKIHAATDITGFGLLGHARHIADGSHVTLAMETSLIPSFAKARACIEAGFLTKAHRTNREYVQASVEGFDRVDGTSQQLLFDPQTSGGLLLSVDRESSAAILQILNSKFPRACRIGTVQAASHIACILNSGMA